MTNQSVKKRSFIMMAETKYLGIVPSSEQKVLQKMGFYLFIHFGMNTMFGSEGGDGKEDPSAFSPSKLDTDQWARVAKEIGAGAIIFTAKHQDGFCLWPTKTTEYSLKNSPYMDGKGDIVRLLADSCSRYGLKLGFYLSPGDRNSPCYGTDEYNDFYCRQMTELLTNYGDIFCLWFDVCQGGELPILDGKKQIFDYQWIFETARRLQPGIILANAGPDVRWVGNEASMTRKSEWSVVPACVCPAYSQSYTGKTPAPLPTDEDLGSEEVLSKYDEYMWYPAEVDYSLHKGWFYHSLEMPRKLSRLYSAYMRSVGGNCTFLLNVPPNKDGLFAKRDVRRLYALKRKVDRTFSDKISDSLKEIEIGRYQIDGFGNRKVRTVVLREDTDFSQRVEEFVLAFYKNAKLVHEEKGTVIGFSKFVELRRPIQCDKIVLSVLRSRGEKVYICSFEIYG